MTKYAFERMRAGNQVTGIVEVPQSLSIGIAIEDILTIAACSSLAFEQPYKNYAVTAYIWTSSSKRSDNRSFSFSRS